MACLVRQAEFLFKSGEAYVRHEQTVPTSFQLQNSNARAWLNTARKTGTRIPKGQGLGSARVMQEPPLSESSAEQAAIKSPYETQRLLEQASTWP